MLTKWHGLPAHENTHGQAYLERSRKNDRATKKRKVNVMKTTKNYKIILSAIIFFLTATCVYSYPPDNAAVLYYKAAVLYEVDEEMANMLADLSKDRIEVNDKIREFVKKNHLVINTVLDAAEIKNCDWGIDISQGIETEVPHISKMKRLSRLVIADAKILAKDGR